jgi:uncharacterized protein YjeT (DUF2065 family)
MPNKANHKRPHNRGLDSLSLACVGGVIRKESISMSKYFNIFAGLIFVVLGFIGFLFPDFFAKVYGFSLLSIESKTEVRALSGFSIGVGYLITHFAVLLSNQKVVLFSLGVLLLAFITPRIIGLIIDGVNQPTMIKELGFESIALIVVFFLYKREVRNGNV